MITKSKEKELRLFAAQIRQAMFEELTALGFGHVGGAMSIAEVLAVLYGGMMKVDPQRPDWEERDWFALSKGHAGPALYAALALRGFFPAEELKTLNQKGTRLPSHCSRIHTPGVDLTTGSLGTGFSAAIGAALGSRILGGDNYAYCIVGDGECDEGQIWEGALFAAAQKLDNLILFVDNNKKQLDGLVADICPLGDIAAKFREFGWDAQTVNGHDVAAIWSAVEAAKNAEGRPSVIVLDTVKGKGCALAETVAANHHITFSDPEAVAAEKRRLQAVIDEIAGEEV